MESERTPFQSQFIFSQEILDDLQHWKQERVGKWFLYAGLRAEICSYAEDNRQLVLIGYWYDFRNPESSNSKILKKLMVSKTFESLLDELAYLSGVYALVWRCDDDVRIIPDMCALKEIYYHTHPLHAAVGSSPNIISRYVTKGLTRLNGFYDSASFRRRGVWVGNTTSFEGVFRLKPNHYLELSTMKVHRFFPRNEREEKEMRPVAIRASNVLTGILHSVHSRRERIFMGLTSGWDTRVLLASSKKYLENTTFVVGVGSNVPKFDHQIPVRLASKLGLGLVKLHYNNACYPLLSQMCEELPNVSEDNAHKTISFRNVFGDCKTISGSASEIARNHYGSMRRVDGLSLANLVGYGGENYCHEIYTDWILNSGTLFRQCDYDLLDMFYWEESMGNWLAKNISENEAVGRSLYPIFNCRHLMEMLLSVNRDFRLKQFNPLYTEMIRLLWKEALDIPINPGIKKSVIKYLQMAGLYGMYRKTVGR